MHSPRLSLRSVRHMASNESRHAWPLRLPRWQQQSLLHRSVVSIIVSGVWSSVYLTHTSTFQWCLLLHLSRATTYAYVAVVATHLHHFARPLHIFAVDYVRNHFNTRVPGLKKSTSGNIGCMGAFNDGNGWSGDPRNPKRSVPPSHPITPYSKIVGPIVPADHSGAGLGGTQSNWIGPFCHQGR